MYTETVESERLKLTSEIACEDLGYGSYRVNVGGGGYYVLEFQPASRRRAFDGAISVSYYFGEKSLFAQCYHEQNNKGVGEKRFRVADTISALMGIHGFIGAAGFKMDSEYDRENSIGTDFGLVKKLQEPTERLFPTMRLAALLADAFIVELLNELAAQKIDGISIGPSSPKVKKLLGY